MTISTLFCLKHPASFALFIAYVVSFAMQEWVITYESSYGLWRWCSTANDSDPCHAYTLGDSPAYYEVVRVFACIAFVFLFLSIWGAIEDRPELSDSVCCHIVVMFPILGSASLTVSLAVLGAMYSEDDRWKDTHPTLGASFWLALVVAALNVLLSLCTGTLWRREYKKRNPTSLPITHARRSSTTSVISIIGGRKMTIFHLDLFSAPQSFGSPLADLDHGRAVRYTTQAPGNHGGHVSAMENDQRSVVHNPRGGHISSMEGDLFPVVHIPLGGDTSAMKYDRRTDDDNFRGGHISARERESFPVVKNPRQGYSSTTESIRHTDSHNRREEHISAKESIRRTDSHNFREGDISAMASDRNTGIHSLRGGHTSPKESDLFVVEDILLSLETINVK